MKKYFLVLSAFALVFLGCKKGAQSKLQSIDEVAGASKTPSFCGPSDEEFAKLNAPMKTKLADMAAIAKSALSSKPADVIEWQNAIARVMVSAPDPVVFFFATHRGNISLEGAESLQKICTRNNQTFNGLSCSSTQGDGRPTIHLLDQRFVTSGEGEKISVVDATLIRELTYSYLMFTVNIFMPKLASSRGLLSSQGGAMLSIMHTKLNGIAAGLAGAAALDLENAAKTQPDIAQVIAGYRRFFGQDYAKAPGFQALVLGEATDSYYCSPKSRGIFGTSKIFNVDAKAGTFRVYSQGFAKMFGKAWFERFK